MLTLLSPEETQAQVMWDQLIDMKNITAMERAQLPEYCPHTQTYHEGGPEYQRWIDRLGRGFSAMHHYCWGVLKAYRATTLAGGTQLRNALLADAVREIEYVVRNTPEDFLLRPEVLLRGGQWSAKLERYPLALDYFEASIQAKPDYWPAYLEIANVNLAIHRRQQAIDALKLGLERSPAHPALEAALARIASDRTLGLPRTQRATR
jgi:tetratricopeptide (TPR) repeat protein